MAKLTKKEQEIAKNMELLDLTREEAEELWLFDNDEIDNEVVAAIESREKEEKQEKEKRTSIEKVKYMTAKVKGDDNKEAIIEDIFNSTQASENVFHCQEITATKMSFVDKDGNFYTVQVTKHKNRPAKYNADLG